MSKSLRDALKEANRGKAVLFCGAGASLDSIGFDLQDLPAASPLLGKFNDFLGKDLSKLPIAASMVADKSAQDYYRIITDCFRVKQVSDDMRTIISYPWTRVYSTNYDDSVEIACGQIGKKYQTLTAQDKPSAMLPDRLPIVHLHGFVNHFRIDTIRDECILDYSSNVANKVYDGPWATEIKNDISTSEIVIFLGYSLYDPEIAKLLLQGATSRRKIYFINFRVENEELAYAQKQFGTPLNIEKDGLAKIISTIPTEKGDLRKKYVCFRSASDLSVEHRNVNYEDLSDLFLFGRIQDGLLQSDIVSNTSSYIIKPSIVKKIKSELRAGRTLISLYSPLGHGKTILSKILVAELSREHDVFFAVRNQENFMSEVKEIISQFKEPIFILDDFYKFSKHHNELSKISAKDACFIFTARLNVHESRKEELLGQFLNHEIVEMRIGEFTDDDAQAFVPLINQAGMWGSESELTDEMKSKRLLSTGEHGFQANFADILVGLMSSSEMIARVSKELRILTGR